MHNSNYTITNTLDDHTINSDLDSTASWLGSNYPYVIGGVLTFCCLCCCCKIYFKRRNAEERQRLRNNDDDISGYLLDTSASRSKPPNKKNSIVSQLFNRKRSGNDNDNSRMQEGSLDVNPNDNDNVKLQQDDLQNNNDGQSCKSEGIVKIRPGGTHLF